MLISYYRRQEVLCLGAGGGWSWGERKKERERIIKFAPQMKLVLDDEKKSIRSQQMDLGSH